MAFVIQSPNIQTRFKIQQRFIRNQRIMGMEKESTTNVPGNASFRQKNLHWFVLSNLSLCFFLSVLQVSF